MDQCKMAQRTRSKCECPVFGDPASIKESVLPTYEDVIKDYLFVRQDLLAENARSDGSHGRPKEPTVTEVATVVVIHLEEVWKRASLPTITSVRILERIRDYHNKYRKLLKPYKQRSGNEFYQSQIREFQNAAKRLFDIATCKCTNFATCSCDKSRKIPIEERKFVIDQRTVRKMAIGSVDFKTTQKLQRREKRKQSQTDLGLLRDSKAPKTAGKQDELSLEVGLSMETEHLPENEVSNSAHVIVEDGIKLIDASGLSPCVSNTVSITSLSTSSSSCKRPDSSAQMRKKLPTLARECDRWGLSDRSAAAITSAVLQDFGIVSKEDSAYVIDPSKIRRERKKHRRELQDTVENTALEALYFDGRKDLTRKQVKTNGPATSTTYHPISVNEEHIVLVQEPGSKYVGHVAPDNGTSLSITESIMNYLTLKSYSLEQLVAIGCDGTNVNTGVDNGVIRQLEVKVQRPLHWFVCLLHLNELPLRHLLVYLDGVTQGPKSFSGPIGKALKNCLLPVVQFKSIDGNALPEVDVAELSNDQKYLYKMCTAVTSGNCSKQLAELQPGPMAHSRWLTTASRILRLYVATPNPSESLISLVTYIVKVYVPVWFEIKTKPLCHDGSRHLWKLISYTRYLPADIKKVIEAVIQRNAYFAHPENLLLAMLTDERTDIRKMSLRRILRAKASLNIGSVPVRKFKVPKLNFEAKEYFEMIDHQCYSNVEPPLTRCMTSEKIQSYISGDRPAVIIPKFPCHTQTVERCVRLVTEASSSVGEEQRDGFIRARLESRSVIKQFNKKADYNVT